MRTDFTVLGSKWHVCILDIRVGYWYTSWVLIYELGIDLMRLSSDFTGRAHILYGFVYQSFELGYQLYGFGVPIT